MISLIEAALCFSEKNRPGTDCATSSNDSMEAEMRLWLVCLAVAWLLLAGGVHAQSGSVAQTFIYVSDFDLEAENVHEDKGVLPHPLGGAGPIARLRSSIRQEEDPQVKAGEIVDLMSDSVVNDLKKLGYPSRRLRPGEPLPEEGVLLRGLFANVDEGNRLRRAAIGFGAGHTDLQVIVSAATLGKDGVQPFYDVNTGAQKGKLPGALITLNPYVGAAKFVLSGRDMKKGIKQTASKIASEIDKQLKDAAKGNPTRE